LQELQLMSPKELKEELINNPYYNNMFVDLSQYKQEEPTENLHEEEIHIDDQQENKNTQLNSSKSPKREESYKLTDENEEVNEKSESYQKGKDYISYGYDYVSMERDPQKVDINLPISDYVYQLLCNSQCTDEIFKEKMIEYQYHKDKPIEAQINRIKRQLDKGKCLYSYFSLE